MGYRRNYAITFVALVVALWGVTKAQPSGSCVSTLTSDHSLSVPQLHHRKLNHSLTALLFSARLCHQIFTAVHLLSRKQSDPQHRPYRRVLVQELEVVPRPFPPLVPARPAGTRDVSLMINLTQQVKLNSQIHELSELIKEKKKCRPRIGFRV